PAAFDFYGIDAEPRGVAQGKLQHGDAIRGAGGKRSTLPGIGGGDQFYPIQIQACQRRLRQSYMSQVDRVETTTQQADSYTHARGFRKSASAASGVSSLGDQL